MNTRSLSRFFPNWDTSRGFFPAFSQFLFQLCDSPDLSLDELLQSFDGAQRHHNLSLPTWKQGVAKLQRILSAAVSAQLMVAMLLRDLTKLPAGGLTIFSRFYLLGI